ncbi:hypothetical protein H8E88_13390 [candidate division KSB1 bacterium]|nr:hypothetical protein [candidate division KSB1 bacterium]MBL7094402.1 hypothetical protein [candidate division KSB1 bacterium]
MKTRLLAVLVITLIFTTMSYAFDFKSEQPMLISSAGQSADILMVKILAKKANLKFTVDKAATPDKLKDQATLVLVSGGSTKGLGAAKTDKQQEINRIKSLIDEAKKQKKNVIIMHVGGKARRGKLSDEFNKLTAERADCLVVVKGGDKDQFFSNIAKEKKIPIKLIDKIMEAGDVLKNIFSKVE